MAVSTVAAGTVGVPTAAQADCPSYPTDCGYTRMSVAASSPTAGHRARIGVVVLGPSGQGPTGQVVVRLRGPDHTRATFRAAYEGEAVRLRTRRLPAGKYVVTAAFSPEDGSEARAASDATAFRVRRR